MTASARVMGPPRTEGNGGGRTRSGERCADAARRGVGDGGARRRAAYVLGLRAEDLTAWWLRLAGYRIVARRLRSDAGEIDLVARRGAVVAFVEVKARTGAPDGPEDPLTATAERRIRAAADVFLARHPELASRTVRFDLALFGPRSFRYVADAF